MSRYSSSRNSSLLQDNSWIRKTDDDVEDIDKDPNFGKSVLSHYKSSETLTGSGAEQTTTKPIRTSTSVQALTKRFSTSQDELNSNLPLSRTSSYTKSTTSKIVTGDPQSSTKTTTVTKDGTTETIITTTQTVRSPIIGSPTQTFNDRVKSSSKGSTYSTYSPTKTTKVTETTVTSNKAAEDKLYDTLIPSSISADYSPKDSKTTVSTTETVTVKSSSDTTVVDKLYDTLIPRSIRDDFSPTDSNITVFSTKTVTVKSSDDGNGIKTTTTTRTSSTAEDELYDTLLPKSITSPVRGSPTLSSPSSTSRTISYSSYPDDVSTTRTTSYTISTKPSDDYSSEHKTYTYTRPSSSYEYNSVTSPTVYTTKTSTKSVYASPERTVLEKDLCTYCHKPFSGEAKMVLDDMRIKCHASCFKCEVCNGTLGHMRAGDTLWIYKRMVHCENCFDVTREKWKR